MVQFVLCLTSERLIIELLLTQLSIVLVLTTAKKQNRYTYILVRVDYIRTCITMYQVLFNTKNTPTWVRQFSTSYVPMYYVPVTR